MTYEIRHNWGFGMSPIKPKVQRERELAIARLLASFRPLSEAAVSIDISLIKGLFNRVWREDQWDWFTVKAQFGYPSGRLCRKIGDCLDNLRQSVVAADKSGQQKWICALNVVSAERCLQHFLGLVTIKEEPDAGWIYILSRPDERDILKIGLTSRSVEERVKEINSATGVIAPLGVRACWRVDSPNKTERLIHKLLATNRVRADREFFRIDFKEAHRMIQGLLDSEGLELRSLDSLVAVLPRRQITTVS